MSAVEGGGGVFVWLAYTVHLYGFFLLICISAAPGTPRSLLPADAGVGVGQEEQLVGMDIAE
jgi:hypothetical protein